MSGKDAEPYAAAVGRFLVDRYGSAQAIKKTIETDPVGVAADISMLLSGGGTAAARLPGLAGRAGEIAAAAGRAVNPLSVAAPALRVGGRVASEALGLTTGAGGEAVRTAAAAGREGGEAAQAFLQNMRDQAPAEEVVNDARGAVAQLRAQRGKIYRQEMAKVGGDKTVLNFNDIDKAVANTVKKFKGQSISPSTARIQNAISKTVEAWKQLNPADFHTAEGLDALKQKIGDLRDNTQYGSPQRLAADKVYKAIKDTISKQQPKYAKIMKGYQEASDQIREIERTLSVNPKASIDTALRKITSALRDNVNTNFGKRRELVNFLAQSGATHLLQKIAGQSLKSAMPRGLEGRMLAGGEGLAALTAFAAGNPAIAAKLAAVISLSSPRLVGEGAYKAGQLSRLPLRGLGLTSRAIGAASQAGP